MVFQGAAGLEMEELRDSRFSRFDQAVEEWNGDRRKGRIDRARQWTSGGIYAFSPL